VPSSRCDHIPTVINFVRQLQPHSILDIGVGFGKWGHLFREYTDIVQSELDPSRYRRENWQTRIEGIEGFAPYITPLHEYLYDEIHIGDVCSVLPRLGRYDVIFAGDVIEHLEKAAGIDLVKECLRHADRGVIFSTPAVYVDQPVVCDNELEIHKSRWTADDFAAIAPCVTQVTENNILVAAYAHYGATLTAGATNHATDLRAEGIRALSRALVECITARIQRCLRPASFSSFPGSNTYWNERYRTGGTSGAGSYGALAEYKAHVLNQLIREHAIESVVDWGCGDGNQLALLDVPHYLGLDVSSTVIDRLRAQYAGDSRREFKVLNTATAEVPQAEMALSMDVVYHLTEDDVFERYMDSLFNSGTRLVVIYSSNHAGQNGAPHVRDREFASYVAAWHPGWQLVRTIPNPYRLLSRAQFFIYGRRTKAGISAAEPAHALV